MKRIYVFLLAMGLSKLYAYEDPNLFGMMGGALGETLRLNAAQPTPVGDVDPGPCVVTLGFADSAGAAAGRSLRVALSPGQSAFVEFDFSAVVTRLGQRLEVRPVVIPAFPGSAAGCRFSAELYDRLTGRTSAYTRQATPVPIGDTPIPIGDFAPIGAALGQLMRLNMVAVNPGPCRAALGFTNASGAPVGPTTTVSLLPGQAAFIDLPMSLFPLTFGQRVEIRPVVRADPTAASCLASVEVWDGFSGRTGTYVSGPVPQGDR